MFAWNRSSTRRLVQNALHVLQPTGWHAPWACGRDRLIRPSNTTHCRPLTTGWKICRMTSSLLKYRLHSHSRSYYSNASGECRTLHERDTERERERATAYCALANIAEYLVSAMHSLFLVLSCTVGICAEYPPAGCIFGMEYGFVVCVWRLLAATVALVQQCNFDANHGMLLLRLSILVTNETGRAILYLLLLVSAQT